MSQTIQNIYEKFITKNGAKLDSVAPEIFAFSSDDILVVANTDRVMRNVFEMEKSNLFAFNRSNPDIAKTKHYKLYDNTDETNTFFAKPKIDENFKYAIKIDEDLVKDFDSDFLMGGASFVIFTKDSEKLKAFLTKIRDWHFIECEIPVDEKKSSIVPGMTIKFYSKDGEVHLKKNGEYRTKQELDHMPQTLEKAISEDKEKTL